MPLIIRAVGSPAVAVKGRALPVEAIEQAIFRVGNISDRGIQFLSQFGFGGVQIEFVLTSAKVVFNTTIAHINRQDCVMNLPTQLVSIERRKDARFAVLGNARAYISLTDWIPDPRDLTAGPQFESSKNLSNVLPVGDVSMGGISLVTRFPSPCKIMDRNLAIEPCLFYLPMMAPFELDVSIRWTKRLKESVQDADGRARIIKIYKFGLQFVNSSELLKRNLQLFIQKISQAEAI